MCPLSCGSFLIVEVTDHRLPHPPGQKTPQSVSARTGKTIVAIRIILADDHQAYRQHLRAMLEQEPDMIVIAEAEDGQTVVRLVREMSPSAPPGLVIMDVTMPRLNGIDATRQIISTHPWVKVLALSMHTDPSIVQAMTQSGAAGYVCKNDPFSALTHAIRAVVAEKANN